MKEATTANGIWANFTIGGCPHDLRRFDKPGETWIICIRPDCDYVEQGETER